MDRINGLSDDIICHILSFLPIKEAALTSVLSKRWPKLFAFTPNLLIDDLEVGGDQSFIDFMDRVLAVSENFPIRKISIKCRNSIDSGHVTRWMIDALKRGVVDLDIDIPALEGVVLRRIEIFTCKTMVELKLAKGFDAIVPEDVSLPSLKTLFLDSIYFYQSHYCVLEKLLSFYNSHYCVLEKLLSACPVLEELTFCGVSWPNDKRCHTLSSSTLKKLTLKCTKFNIWGMTFDTPSLAYLEYTDAVPREYPIVNLESLVEAKLDLCCRFGISNPTNLIKGLRNVEVLELSIRTSEMLYHFREAIPVFSNLIRLSITTNFYYYDWKYFPTLLKNSPNLQTLIIKGPFPVDKCEGEYGLSYPVKILKITEYGGTIAELEQVKHFLEKLSCLELVKVRACAINDKEKYRITKDLLMVPRSSKCNIKIKFYEKIK